MQGISAVSGRLEARWWGLVVGGGAHVHDDETGSLQHVVVFHAVRTLQSPSARVRQPVAARPTPPAAGHPPPGQNTVNILTGHYMVL